MRASQVIPAPGQMTFRVIDLPTEVDLSKRQADIQ
jgi:hypothetical protein